MSIKGYDEKGLLLNISFINNCSDDSFTAFRGRVSLVEAEVGDQSGNRKTPAVVMEQGVLMSKDEKLIFSAGSFDKLEHLKLFTDMYKDDFSPEMQGIFYVVDLTEPLQVELEGINFSLTPMQEGLTWNELLDEAALDKGDLKGKSSADKVYSVWEELKSFKPAGNKVSFDEALAKTDAQLKRPERGAL